MMQTLGKVRTNKVGNFIFYAIILVLLGRLVTAIYSYSVNYRETKKNVICPPLLSIGRSARDTLIIMKAEPLCNVYVLNNLK